MAFQPVVDVASGTIFAHEALVRGADGQGAGFVLSQVSEESAGELAALRDLGVRLIQGYLLAKPSFQSLATQDDLAPRLSSMAA